MTPMTHDKFHENWSARFSEIWNTDTKTDRQTRQDYIDEVYWLISESMIRYVVLQRFLLLTYCKHMGSVIEA